MTLLLQKNFTFIALSLGLASNTHFGVLPESLTYCSGGSFSLESIDISHDPKFVFNDEKSTCADNVIYKDVNFDGFDDVVLSSLAGAYNIASSIYIYCPIKKRFAYYNNGYTGDFDSVGGKFFGLIQINKDKKQVSSFVKIRGLGDEYTLDIYTWTEGSEYLLSESIVSEVSHEDDTYIYYDLVYVKNDKKEVYKMKSGKNTDGTLKGTPTIDFIQKKLQDFSTFHNTQGE